MARVLAWIGGAVFVASLVLTAWWYFIHLDRVEPPHGLIPVLADAALIAIFALHHSLFAREPVKRALTAIPPSLIRSVYVWVASLLLVLVIACWQPIGGTVYAITGRWSFLNGALQAIGLVLIARAVAGLDPLELAGIRQASGAAPRYEPLQISGPYRLVRHPLYLGWIVTLFAAAHMTGDRLAFAIMTAAYLVIAVPWEERSLVQSFGEDYRRYRERVRWRIIPFVY